MKRPELFKTILTTSIIIVLSTILNPNNTYAGFTEALQEYCVPKDGNCSIKAIYGIINSKSACICQQCNTFYDRNSRSCQRCGTGKYVKNTYSTECSNVCPAGYRAEIKSDSTPCPAGYYRKELTGCGN